MIYTKEMKGKCLDVATDVNYDVVASFSSWSKFMCNPEWALQEVEGPLTTWYGLGFKPPLHNLHSTTKTSLWRLFHQNLTHEQ